MNPKKPNFLIVGSAKCGTTALASILGSHPDCCMSQPKEVSFFQDNVDFKPNPNYEKGWDWYKQAFAHYVGESFIGEATPSYSDRSRSPNTARRIYNFNPDMKIVYMVRDPLQRQISGWKMQYAVAKAKSFPGRREHQWALKGFDYWMQMQRDVKQWDECRYGYQLAAYEDFFPAKNIYVSFLEDWQYSKEVEVDRIMCFLGLDPGLWQRDIQEESNRASGRTIDRPEIKKIRTNPIVKNVAKYLPISWRNWLRQGIARAQINYPSIQMSEATQSEFVGFLIQDAQDFLSSRNKGLDLWKTLGVSVCDFSLSR